MPDWYLPGIVVDKTGTDCFSVNIYPERPRQAVRKSLRILVTIGYVFICRVHAMIQSATQV